MPLYNRELSSGCSIMVQDDWEDQILKQMVEMFRSMGLDVSEKELSRMMTDIQSQFENMETATSRNHAIS